MLQHDRVRRVTVDISVLIPVRNRSGQRLENCLRSLAWQDLDPIRMETVLSDFGSDPEHARSIEVLARAHGARVVRSETREIWNRSRALNIAIRAARGRFVLCTDADMIFEPNYVRTALELLEQDERRLVVCRCLDLPQNMRVQSWTIDDYQQLRSRARYRQSKGTGACQATLRDWFVRVRGYDEKYVFWGFEDTDLLRRAERDGLRVTWMQDQTAMLHQWHPTNDGSRPLLKYANKLRFWFTQRSIEKNRNGWGEARG